MTQARSVLVTGASRGIGEAVARRLAAVGWRVIAAARSRLACEALARELSAAGAGTEALELDVADPGSIARAVSELARRGVALDALVNNAGIAISAPLVHAGEDLVERHLAVNFHGPRRLIEAVLPGMKRRGYGRIVNVASSAGLAGYKYVSAYCASKHALVGYSRAAADELAGSGVSIACVCPHYVDSPMTDASARRIAEKTGRGVEESRALLAAANPSGRLVTVDQVAAAVLDLLGDDRNGWIVELDGASSRVVERAAR